jgi:hypothetical protein
MHPSDHYQITSTKLQKMSQPNDRENRPSIRVPTILESNDDHLPNQRVPITNEAAEYSMASPYHKGESRDVTHKKDTHQPAPDTTQQLLQQLLQTTMTPSCQVPHHPDLDYIAPTEADTDTDVQTQWRVPIQAQPLQVGIQFTNQTPPHPPPPTSEPSTVDDLLHQLHAMSTQPPTPPVDRSETKLDSPSYTQLQVTYIKDPSLPGLTARLQCPDGVWNRHLSLEAKHQITLEDESLAVNLVNLDEFPPTLMDRFMADARLLPVWGSLSTLTSRSSDPTPSCWSALQEWWELLQEQPSRTSLEQYYLTGLASCMVSEYMEETLSDLAADAVGLFMLDIHYDDLPPASVVEVGSDAMPQTVKEAQQRHRIQPQERLVWSHHLQWVPFHQPALSDPLEMAPGYPLVWLNPGTHIRLQLAVTRGQGQEHVRWRRAHAWFFNTPQIQVPPQPLAIADQLIATCPEGLFVRGCTKAKTTGATGATEVPDNDILDHLWDEPLDPIPATVTDIEDLVTLDVKQAWRCRRSSCLRCTEIAPVVIQHNDTDITFRVDNRGGTEDPQVVFQQAIRQKADILPPGYHVRPSIHGLSA